MHFGTLPALDLPPCTPSLYFIISLGSIGGLCSLSPLPLFISILLVKVCIR